MDWLPRIRGFISRIPAEKVDQWCQTVQQLDPGTGVMVEQLANPVEWKYDCVVNAIDDVFISRMLYAQGSSRNQHLHQMKHFLDDIGDSHLGVISSYPGDNIREMVSSRGVNGLSPRPAYTTQCVGLLNHLLGVMGGSGHIHDMTGAYAERMLAAAILAKSGKIISYSESDPDIITMEARRRIAKEFGFSSGGETAEAGTIPPETRCVIISPPPCKEGNESYPNQNVGVSDVYPDMVHYVEVFFQIVVLKAFSAPNVSVFAFTMVDRPQTRGLTESMQRVAFAFFGNMHTFLLHGGTPWYVFTGKRLQPRLLNQLVSNRKSGQKAISTAAKFHRHADLELMERLDRSEMSKHRKLWMANLKSGDFFPDPWIGKEVRPITLDSTNHAYKMAKSAAFNLEKRPRFKGAPLLKSEFFNHVSQRVLQYRVGIRITVSNTGLVGHALRLIMQYIVCQYYGGDISKFESGNEFKLYGPARKHPYDGISNCEIQYKYLGLHERHLGRPHSRNAILVDIASRNRLRPIEAFANSTNAYPGIMYCSLFSYEKTRECLGNFFSLTPRRAVLLANPPCFTEFEVNWLARKNDWLAAGATIFYGRTFYFEVDQAQNINWPKAVEVVREFVTGALGLPPGCRVVAVMLDATKFPPYDHATMTALPSPRCAAGATEKRASVCIGMTLDPVFNFDGTTELGPLMLG